MIDVDEALKNHRGKVVLGLLALYCIFIILFAVLYQLQPTCLAATGTAALKYNVGASAGQPVHSFWSVAYFSVVTQTSTGYGDILPATSYSKIIAGVQAIVGQLYFAILVGLFIGRMASHIDREKSLK